MSGNPEERIEKVKKAMRLNSYYSEIYLFDLIRATEWRVVGKPAKLACDCTNRPGMLPLMNHNGREKM
jgi:hypothetical protein